jgi:hypothetical protein
MVANFALADAPLFLRVTAAKSICIGRSQRKTYRRQRKKYSAHVTCGLLDVTGSPQLRSHAAIGFIGFPVTRSNQVYHLFAFIFNSLRANLVRVFAAYNCIRMNIYVIQ